jgi:predicted ArsR family transcriptional regulator
MRGPRRFAPLAHGGRLENFAKSKSQDMFRLWDSRIPKAESEAAADQLVDIIESADP